jgi:uncharacterized protein YndB with AHSA1/START domain
MSDDAKVSLRRMVMLRVPPDQVWCALRDELPSIAKWMKGIRSITRLEHAADLSGNVSTVHEWCAAASLPAAFGRMADGDALSWVERASWHEDSRVSRWTVESRMLAGSLTGSGSTRLEAAMGGRGSRLSFEISATLGAGALGPLGQGRFKGGIEDAAASLLAKTLQELGAAVEVFVANGSTGLAAGESLTRAVTGSATGAANNARNGSRNGAH